MKQETFKQLKDHIKEYEGLSNVLYKCTSNKVSIGYGRNLEDVGISKDEAEYLLKNDIDIALDEVSEHFDMPNLPEPAQIVLVDMCFNMGISRLLNFRNMIKAMEQDDWDKAADELLDSKYAAQTKRRARMNASLLISCKDV
jgi:lysozyme